MHVVHTIGAMMRRSVVSGVAVFVAPVLRAQTLAPTPPAVCTAQTASPVAALTDTSAINGVVVRLSANATGKPTDAHLAKALSALTAERLQMLVEAPVRSRFDVALARSANNSNTAVSDGRVLGVRWVVAGRAERHNDTVTVTWNVLDSRSGVVRGSGITRDALVHLDGLSNSLATSIATKIGVSTPTASTLPKSAPMARSVPAFEAYLEGLFEFDSFDPALVRRAIVALQRAVTQEPTLQPAWTALAESLTRLVEFGEGGSARGRSQRSRDALMAANRALALAPRDARSLVVLAQLHLLRDEPIAAAQVIDGLRVVAPTSDELRWLAIELAMVKGDAKGISQSLDTTLQQFARNTRTLFTRAEIERRHGQLGAACTSLNRLLVLEPTWAPAYVQRALVRTSLGDLRGGWQDAEMATRLGQPSWGNMVSALIDFSVNDSLRTRARLKNAPPIGSGTVLPWLDALLQGAVWRATGQPERALRALSVTPCDDPHRRQFVGDPLLKDLPVKLDGCRASIGLTQPAGDLP